MKTRLIFLVAAMMVFLAGPAAAGIRFGTGSAVNHRVEELDRRVEEEQQRLRNTANVNSPSLELMDNVTVLDNSSMQKLATISSDSGTIKFSSSTEQLVSLNVGDVLIVPASDTYHYPLSRVITGIEPNGSGITFITRQAALTEVIKNCSLDVTHNYTLNDFQWQDTGPAFASRRASRSSRANRAPALAPNYIPEWDVSLEGNRVRVDLTFDSVVYDLDGNTGTTADQIVASGSLIIYPVSYEPAIDIVNYPLSGPRVKRLELRNTFEVHGRVDYTWGVGASGEKSFSLFEKTLAPIMLVPPPSPVVIWIHPVLSLEANIKGEISGQITTAVYGSVKVVATSRYTPEAGVQAWVNVDTSYGYDSPTLAVTGHAEANLVFGLAGYVESLAGLKIDAGAFVAAELEATKAPYPWWELSAGVQTTVGFACSTDLLEDAIKAVFDIDELPSVTYKKVLWSMESPSYGTLEISANEPSAKIYVNNIWVATGYYRSDVPEGSYRVHFSPIQGLLSPADSIVVVVYDATASYHGVYVSPAYINIVTNTPSAPIYVDNSLMQYGSGMFPVAPGYHEVRFGDVAGGMFLANNTPWPVDPRVFFPDTVAAGFLTHNILTGTTVSGMTYNINGNYVAAGRLSLLPSWWDTVTTSVFAITAINGQAVTPTVSYGQDALTPAGNYTFTFSLAPGLGYINPYAAVPPNQPQSVGNTLVDYWDMEPDTLSFTVIAGSNNQYVFPMIMAVSAGTTGPDGFPGADVYVDGFTWTGLQAMFVVGAPAIHEIRFQDIPGYITPPTVNVLYEPNHFMNVNGRYTQ